MKSNTKMAQFLALACVFGGIPNHIKHELENVDIDKEYELIQQKKSKLSARLRKIIVYKYESRS